jgi:uncharacterized SAM-dependent methyltransferase
VLDGLTPPTRTDQSKCASAHRTRQLVTIRALGFCVRFDAGEEIRTEISAKFTRPRLESDLAAEGLSGPL